MPCSRRLLNDWRLVTDYPARAGRVLHLCGAHTALLRYGCLEASSACPQGRSGRASPVLNCLNRGQRHYRCNPGQERTAPRRPVEIGDRHQLC